MQEDRSRYHAQRAVQELANAERAASAMTRELHRQLAMLHFQRRDDVAHSR